MNSISSNLNLMIKACEKASKVIIRDFGELENLQVSKKGPKDFVTKTDKRVEKILIEEFTTNNSRQSVPVTGNRQRQILSSFLQNIFPFVKAGISLLLSNFQYQPTQYSNNRLLN